MKALCACVLVALNVSSLAAQENPSSAKQEPKATIVLGDATAPPEWELRVPVSLTLSEGTAVSRLTLRVDYPAQVLRYQQVETSELLKSAGLELKAELLTSSATSQTASLRLGVQASGKEPTPLPAGALGNLVFKVADVKVPDTKLPDTKVPHTKVADTAKPRSWPMTAEDVRAWSSLPPFTEVGARSGRTAKITVAPAGLPIFACFFYMH